MGDNLTKWRRINGKFHDCVCVRNIVTVSHSCLEGIYSVVIATILTWCVDT